MPTIAKRNFDHLSLKQAREQHVSFVSKMKAILKVAEDEKREMTDLEVDHFDSIKSDTDALYAHILRLERRYTSTEDHAAEDHAAGTFSNGQRRAERQSFLHEYESYMSQPKPRRAGGLQLARPQEEGFANFGEFLHALRFDPQDQRLQHIQAEQRMDTGDRGGFAVPTQFHADVLGVSPLESIVEPRATVLPAGTPPDAALTIPALDQSGSAPHNLFGGVQVSWLGEGAQNQETEAKLREITLTPHEVAAHIVVTDKLLRNWQGSGVYLSNLLRGAMLAERDRCFLRGNSVSKPLGLIDSPAALAVPRNISARITLLDILAMRAALLQQPGGRVAWIASTAIRSELLSLRNYEGESPTVGDGQLIFHPSLREGESDRLLGIEVLWSSELSALGAKGDLVLADLSLYLIKPGYGPIVEASNAPKFLENKTVIKITSFVDGAPALTGPITMPNGVTLSSVVVLDLPS